MSKLVFDLSQEGLLCVLKPYQAEIMYYFWGTQKPMNSRAVHSHLQALGGDVAKSRASVINFLNDMVDEGLLDYTEETGKGGYQRVYSLNTLSRTEQIFRDEVWQRFTPTFLLVYDTSPGSVVSTDFKAINLNDAKKKAREFLRQIVLPTDRPGVSVRWAYLEHLGEKVWLVQEAENR